MAASGFATTLGAPPGVDLRPQPPGGLGLGALLALLVHGGLVLALTLGVQWRTTDPEGVSAELWAAVPQVAAPPAAASPVPPQPQPEVKPPPPPPPAVKAAEPPQAREAQIAIEKARVERERKEQAEREKAEKERADKLKLEKERAEKEKADRLEAEKDAAEKLMKEQAEEQRLAKLREDNLRRMLGQAGGTGTPGVSGTGAPGSTGNAARDAGPSAGYAGRIKARIKPNIVLTEDLAGNPVAEVEVRLAPDGTVVGRTLKKGSGNKDWDEAVLRAIDRTEVLPRDVDGRVPSSMIISFRPKE